MTIARGRLGAVTLAAGLLSGLVAGAASAQPVFTKGFAPSSVPLGARSRLTFTIDNTLGESPAFNLTFSDSLPTGLEVADPPGIAVTCSGGAVSAVPGASTVSYGPLFPGDASVAAGASCTVVLDVVARAAGVLDNTSSELTSFSASGPSTSGPASATLVATATPIALTKELLDDPVAPGGAVTLRFTVTNLVRDTPVTGIAFTDDLDASLPGLIGTGTPLTDPCGAGSTLAGASLLALTGGALASGETCTFDVELQVPSDAALGTYDNVTSGVTGDAAGSPVVGDAASDTLFVFPTPRLVKEFVDDPVGAGGSVTLSFTLSNPSASYEILDIAFTDVFDIILPAASSVPANGLCGGASVGFVPPGTLDPATFTFSGGFLPAGGSCTFDLVLEVAPDAPSGTYPNETSEVTGVVDTCDDGCFEAFAGPAATDDLVVVGAPRLTKSFTDDPVPPGDTVTLELTLRHDELAPAAATSVAFTDDLAAVLAGLTPLGLPLADPCGAGSSLDGATLLSFTGGTLAPGETCTIAVTLQVPAGAVSGTYANTTSDVTATVAGVATVGPPASDDLLVATLVLTKQFVDDPVIPGGTVDLQFTIVNLSSSLAASQISFQDNLGAILPGLAATGPPLSDPCGMGSSFAGATTLTLSGGVLAPGASCTFDVTVQVPADAASDSYVNTTGSFFAIVDGVPVSLANATDVLVVDGELLQLAKEFLDDPVAAGETVTLRFTLQNLSGSAAISGITFTDDLAAALPGLAATGLPTSGVCGAGSQVSGTSLLTLTGAELAAGASCSFDVTLQVPAAASPGQYVNTTSPATGDAGGLPVTGAPATDSLRIVGALLTKAFDGATFPEGAPALTFTIENLDAASAVSGLGFTDDLDAVLPGLIAVGLPASDVCGAGSQIAGTSLLVFSGGSLEPGASCSFAVTLAVPAGAAGGSYPNVTSDLLSSGLFVGAPATDALVVQVPSAFSKSFAPASIVAGQVSTLTFTIDNSASALDATALDFTDVLPAGLEIASPANASTTCTGGALSAVTGAGSVSYTGGAVSAGAVCTVAVDVTAAGVGVFVNVSGALTSSLGSSGVAQATLEATAVALGIPTLSGWSLLALLLGLAGAAVWRLRG
jgi:uncharacterized repeat protein (TIGR01451 family)